MGAIRGWFGEKKAAFSMWLSLDSAVYKRFHDVIVPTRNGTTQIDHLLVSPFGVFIVETKNMSGWIFGAEDQASWMQMFYRKRFPFQNPVRQTFRQKKSLAEYLNLDESIINAVVYFVGDCEFKTRMPANVINSGLGSYIKQFRNHRLSQADVRRVSQALEKHVSESSLTTRDHIRSLRERQGSRTVCPKCGSDLVERTARQGTNAGFKFLGCVSYPRCRFTRDA